MQFRQVPDRRYPCMLVIYLVFSVTLGGILGPDFSPLSTRKALSDSAYRAEQELICKPNVG